MTSNPDSAADLERRLRRLHAALDTTAAFAPALRERIASLRSVEDAEARCERRERANRERRETEARLRRRFWQTLAVTLLLGATAAVGAWLIGAPIGRALGALGRGREAAWNPVALASLTLLIGWLCLAMRSAARGRFRRLVSG